MSACPCLVVLVRPSRILACVSRTSDQYYATSVANIHACGSFLSSSGLVSGPGQGFSLGEEGLGLGGGREGGRDPAEGVITWTWRFPDHSIDVRQACACVTRLSLGLTR